MKVLGKNVKCRKYFFFFIPLLLYLSVSSTGHQAAEQPHWKQAMLDFALRSLDCTYWHHYLKIINGLKEEKCMEQLYHKKSNNRIITWPKIAIQNKPVSTVW